MKIGYVIDSTVDVPKDILEKYDVRVVPLKIIWADKEYKERVDIDSEEFFSRLLFTTAMPRSSAPSPHDFLTAYQELIDKGCEKIVSLHISGKLSGTVQAANIAASMMGQQKIKVLDSYSASIGTGLILLSLIELIETREGYERIEAELDKLRQSLEVYFVVDSLDFLRRGGRIGAAQKLIGQLLDVKPLLGVENGQVVPKGKIFGAQNIVRDIQKLFKEWNRKSKEISYICLAYSNSDSIVKEIHVLVRKYYPAVKVIITQVSPVVGCHVGPGLIGLAVL